MNCFEYEPKAGYGIIYKYTSPNGKNYIGQTIYSAKQRAGTQGQHYKACTAFYHAIQKYGFENLSFEILGEYPIATLDFWEQYYIKEYNTMIPYGYNITPGGKQCILGEKKKTKVIMYDCNGNKVKEYDSIIEAARDNNAFEQVISEVMRHKRNHYKGYIFCYENEKPQKIIPQKTQGRLTAQYDMQNNLIATYPSANQAALAIGKTSNAGRNIRSVCEGKRLTAYGYKWKYLD